MLQDLEPYVCTFSSCGLDTFQSQRSWFEHELLLHRIKWVCFQCPEHFLSSDALRAHIKLSHGENVSDQQLSTLTYQSKRPVDFIQPDECSFCDESWATRDTNFQADEESLVVDLDQFRRHVGHHLQEVALFALPRLIQNDELSRVSHDAGGLQDQDLLSKGYRWIRNVCGSGWNIISRKRIVFSALASFLALYQAHGKSSKLKNEIRDAYDEDKHSDNWMGPSQGGKYETSLSEAAAYGREAEVRSLLARNVDANSKDKRGLTPLRRAAANGHEMVVRLLLQREDIEADFKDRKGQTPLSLAAEYGHERVVQLLLERDDVEADSRDKNGQTPLSRGAEHGHEKVVQLLLQREDVEADSKDDEYYQTPLSRAAKNGHEAVVQMLMNRDDVELDSKDEHGQSPLAHAAAGGHEAVVRLLLERDDVDINSQDEYGRTPLSRAKEKNHQKVIKVLKSKMKSRSHNKLI